MKTGKTIALEFVDWLMENCELAKFNQALKFMEDLANKCGCPNETKWN